MCGDGEPNPPKPVVQRIAQFRADCSADTRLKQESIPLEYEGTKYMGHLAYLEGPPKPLFLIVHNYAGLKQFDKDMACFIARSGVTALAVDMYGAERAPLDLRIKTPENSAQHYEARESLNIYSS